MTSVIETLLETLAALSENEIRGLKQDLIQIHRWTWRRMTELEDTVFSVVMAFGQLSVPTTERVLTRMKRTDLVPIISVRDRDCFKGRRMQKKFYSLSLMSE